MTLKDIKDIFQLAIETEWKSADEMWMMIAQRIGCTEERAMMLGKQFAFVPPFRANGDWLGTPTIKSCKLCAGVKDNYSDLCSFHERKQMSRGVFGEWQYHRICVDGELDNHEDPVMDEHDIPRCPACQKSLLDLPTIEIVKARRAAKLQRIREQEALKPRTTSRGAIFRLMREKLRQNEAK